MKIIGRIKKKKEKKKVDMKPEPCLLILASKCWNDPMLLGFCSLLLLIHERVLRSSYWNSEQTDSRQGEVIFGPNLAEKVLDLRKCWRNILDNRQKPRKKYLGRSMCINCHWGVLWVHSTLFVLFTRILWKSLNFFNMGSTDGKKKL